MNAQLYSNEVQRKCRGIRFEACLCSCKAVGQSVQQKKLFMGKLGMTGENLPTLEVRVEGKKRKEEAVLESQRERNVSNDFVAFNGFCKASLSTVGYDDVPRLLRQISNRANSRARCLTVSIQIKGLTFTEKKGKKSNSEAVTLALWGSPADRGGNTEMLRHLKTETLKHAIKDKNWW
ncbi:hypothetical protein F2P81_017241 [Scophthalmus maximus]|uniref:Uncharacterized protein n=1 Tax=Scophthalmus maximus TaxID=52904 RepID=A0A6A4SF91_SCOMX|nr:hypothetical protein F2P81_017241 [Scophthalmus maximus]